MGEKLTQCQTQSIEIRNLQQISFTYAQQNAELCDSQIKHYSILNATEEFEHYGRSRCWSHYTCTCTTQAK
ncbi:hypothetical protein ACLKA7_002685 [Drosophila subpalustris]